MCRLAMISVHGCPLARLGGKESGGMNVYVRELALALGERSMAVDVFTRLTDPTLPQVVPFGPRARVIHLPAGEVGPLNKNTVLQHLPEFIHRVRSFKEEHRLSYRLVHSHYWLSAWTGASDRMPWAAKRSVSRSAAMPDSAQGPQLMLRAGRPRRRRSWASASRN